MKLRKNNKKRVCIIVIAILVGIILSGYVAIGVYYKSHFLPSSYMMGQDVSNKTIEQAEELLSEVVDNWQLKIVESETEEILNAEDVGLYAKDYDQIISDALNSQEPFLWFKTIIDNETQDISLELTYDKDTLTQEVSKLECVSPEEKIEAKATSYVYENGIYSIVENSTANYIDADSMSSTVMNAIEAGQESIDVTGMYAVVGEAEDLKDRLTKIVDKANLILSSNITVTTVYHSVTLDADSIQSFLVIDEDAGTVDIDEDLVYDWVNDNISGPNYTIGMTRTIETPSSGELTLSGGTYGNWVNVQEETEQIISELKEGAEVEREPAWRITEFSTENSGIGYTYIDVNIDKQTVYYIVDNEIVYSTPCVTGLPNGERDTDKGYYQVLRKAKNYYMKENDVTVNYWMPINDTTGIGLHDATWRSSFGGTIYKTNGSHGCINLSLEAAKWFYENVETGTPVIVH